MKRKLQLALPWFMALLLFVSFNSWGQGTETFDNSTATSSYTDGSFSGNNGITWSYVHSRNEGDYPITGNGIMLRRADEPSSLSATIPGGIGDFSVDTRKAFTGDTQRKLELVINGNVVAQFEPAFGSGADATIIPFVVNDINISGDVTLVLRLYGATGNQQIVLDNVSWTAPGVVTQVATPSISPNGGDFYAPVDVTLSTLTDGASIYYTTDGTDPDETSTLYTAPFTVSSTTTVKAIGVKEGLDNSAIASATFNFLPVTDVATIAELRAGLTDGTAYRLTAEALLTAMDGFNNRKFIQDASAGIMIYDTQGIIETDYAIGDKIQNIIGTLTVANNMLRFVPLADPGAAVSSGNPVVPAVFTLDAVTTDDQAKLVTFKNITFTSTGTFANGQNYTFTDGTNTFVMRTDFWNVDYIGTEIPTTLHNLTGVIIQYNATLQIVPRNLADFYEIPFSTHFQFAAVDATLPAWFGADTERGMAAGGGNLYAVSRNAGIFVRVFDTMTGLETGTLNTTGVTGGTFALNDAEVSGDGVVLAANMAMNTSVDGTAVFKVYQLDATEAPVPVIQYALPGIARLGDKFTVVGNFNDGSAIVYAADGSNPRIFKFTLTDGVFGAPEIIPLGVAQGSTPAVAPLPDGSFYYNANGQSLSKLNADGTLIGTVPGGIISTGSNSIKYLGTDNGDEMVAVFNYGVGQERIKVIRVPAGDPTLATLEFETPSMRGNANANGAGDVAFIPGLEGSVHLYILATNNGFAGYQSLGLNLEFPDYSAQLPLARLQIIHNSADAAVEVVDIFVNGNLFLEDFAFRTATPFVDVPAGVDLNIVVAPADAGIENGVGPVTVNLTEGETYIAIANGIVSGSGYDPAPSFSLDVYPMAREAATTATNTDVLAFHGSTDAPTVSVWETGVGAGEIISDFTYGDFAGYLELPTADYVLEVRTADGETIVVAYSAPLSTLELDGAALTVVASGFLNPAANSDGDAFGLFVALPSGGALIPLPVYEAPTARLQVIHNSADAAVEVVDIFANGDLVLEDFAFRTATPFMDVPAGVDLDIVVAPADAGIENGVGPVTINLTEDETYIAIANGIVSGSGYDPAPSFSLDVYPMAREAATTATNTDVLVFHGSTDAPTVSVWETGAGAGELFTFSYGDFEGYLELGTADYVLEIRTSDGETTVAAYSAPLATLGLEGAAITVVASGFLDPANNSDGAAFGLYVALAGGGDLVALPLYTETFEVTFNVDMTYAEEFDPETDVVYITGDLLGWAEPGTDPENQTMTRVDDSMIWTKTLLLEAGSYEYKYFLNAGWDNGEWDGGDNRSLVVEGDMEVNDWFGYLTDPTSITDPSLAQIRVFPVPANTMLTITSPELIRDVRMIDMLGQLVYSERVSGMEHQINVGEYKNGIYFIQILTDKGMETRRIQIQK